MVAKYPYTVCVDYHLARRTIAVMLNQLEGVEGLKTEYVFADEPTERLRQYAENLLEQDQKLGRYLDCVLALIVQVEKAKGTYKQTETTKKIYVSGPITGVDDWQRFHLDACRRLVYAGYEPVSSANYQQIYISERRKKIALAPTRSDKTVKNWAEWMGYDLFMLEDCDGVALLEGWEQSRGAQIEKIIAKQFLDIPVKPLQEWLA